LYSSFYFVSHNSKLYSTYPYLILFHRWSSPMVVPPDFQFVFLHPKSVSACCSLLISDPLLFLCSWFVHCLSLSVLIHADAAQSYWFLPWSPFLWRSLWSVWVGETSLASNQWPSKMSRCDPFLSHLFCSYLDFIGFLG